MLVNIILSCLCLWLSVWTHHHIALRLRWPQGPVDERQGDSSDQVRRCHASLPLATLGKLKKKLWKITLVHRKITILNWKKTNIAMEIRHVYVREINYEWSFLTAMYWFTRGYVTVCELENHETIHRVNVHLCHLCSIGHGLHSYVNKPDSI